MTDNEVTQHRATPATISNEVTQRRALPAHRDLTRIVFGLVFLAVLIGGSLWVLRPFLPALVWATMIVVATWPLLTALQRRLGNRRSLAVAVMMILLLLVVIAPLISVTSTLVEQAERLLEGRAFVLAIPPPPEWIARLPMVGARLAAEWQAVVDAGPSGLATRVTPYAAQIGSWVLSQLGGLGGLVVHLLLTYVFCGVLWATGEHAGHGLRLFFNRLDGERGVSTVRLAGASVRAVALGVVVTAVVQTVLAALGLWAAGIHYVALLGMLILVCCIAQIGPMPVMFAAVAWIWYEGSHGIAIALAVWTVIVGMLDNVLRPLLIKRGADLPLLLIMAGVIGGLLAFGLVGLFVGPALLAVTWTLVGAWVAEGRPPAT